MRLYRRALLVMAGLIAALALASCGRAPEKALLRYHLNKGDKYELSVTTDQNMSRMIMGNEQSMKQRMGFVYTYDVEDVSGDGVATIKVSFGRITIRIESPMGTVEYDSSQSEPPGQPMLAGLGSMVGQSFTIKMSKSGKVEAVQGTDAMIRAAMSKLSSVPAKVRPSVEALLAQQFDAAALKESFGQMSDIFPARPVVIGDTWRRRVTVSRGLPMIVDTSWTLKERTGEVALIATRATIKPNPKASDIALGSRLQGSGKGTIELDEASGLPKSSVFNQNISYTTSIQNPKSKGEMSMRVEIDGTVTVKSKKV